MTRPPDGSARSPGAPFSERLMLWGIICLAIALRAWGLSHQLPEKAYIEEDEFIYTALKYGSGDLNPHWFFHPPLYSYLLFALYGAYYLVGWAAGWFCGAEDFVLQYLIDPSPFYIIARCLSVALVLPAMLLLHALGRELYSPRCGLIACLFFAVMPLAVHYSHFGCTEPLLIVLVLGVAFLAARAVRTGRGRPLVGAGALAGAALGTKYLGLFSFTLLFAAIPRPREASSWAALAGSLAAAGIAFITVCPFPVLAPREFLSNLSLLATQPLAVGEYGWVRLSNLYAAFALRWMPAGMGIALTWASVAGVVFLWIRRRRADIIVAILPTAFYLLIGRSRLFYDRYMLICYPFFAMAAAEMLTAAASGLSRFFIPSRARERVGRTTSAVLCSLAAAALALPAFVGSVRLVRAMLLPETRFIASRWIAENLPAGARILAEEVPLPQSEESVRREQQLKEGAPRQDFSYREKSGFYFELQRRAARGRKGFDVTRILHPRGFHMVGRGKGYEEEWMTPERMQAQLEALGGYDYVFISANSARRYRVPELLPERFRFLSEFYASLPRRGTVVKVFSADGRSSKGDTYTLYRIDGGQR